jgi:subtilisin
VRLFIGTAEVPAQKLNAQTLTFIVPKDTQAGPQSVQAQSGSLFATATLGVLGDVNPNQLVVTIKPGVSAGEAQKQIEGLGFRFIQTPQPLDPGSSDPNNPCSGTLGVVDVNGKPLGAALAELEKLGIVYKADPQSLGGAGAVDYLGAIGATGTKRRNLSGKGVTIAVLDTGVTATPIAGAGPGASVAGDTVNLLPGFNFVANSGDVTDDFVNPSNQTPLHGTPIAVLAAGARLGVASQAAVLPVKVCDGAGLCLASNVVKGVCYALGQVPDRGKLVLNLSLGGDTPVSVLEAILSYALGKGTLVAAAGGNQGPDIRDGSLVKLTPKHYPAAYKLPGLVAVAALTQDPASGQWSPASFSSRGVNIDYLDIAAPGQDIAVGQYVYEGTSFATPLVAGALALWREANPGMTPADIETKLKAAATLLPFTANEVGAGMLNLSSQP